MYRCSLVIFVLSAAAPAFTGSEAVAQDREPFAVESRGTPAPRPLRTVVIAGENTAPVTRSADPLPRESAEPPPRAAPVRAEPSEPAAPEPARPAGRAHVVRPGESLWGIARRYGLSVDQLRAANDLRNDRLQIGQTLRIPGVRSNDE